MPKPNETINHIVRQPTRSRRLAFQYCALLVDGRIASQIMTKKYSFQNPPLISLVIETSINYTVSSTMSLQVRLAVIPRKLFYKDPAFLCEVVSGKTTERRSDTIQHISGR